MPKIFLGVIRVDTGHLDGLLTCELLLAPVREEVVLDVHEFTFFVDPRCARSLASCPVPLPRPHPRLHVVWGRDVPFERMTTVTVVEPPALGRTVVAEEHHASMISARFLSATNLSP